MRSRRAFRSYSAAGRSTIRAVSPGGRFLYVVDAGAAKISAFAIDGTSLTELAGSPVAIPGGAAPFGMVVD